MIDKRFGRKTALVSFLEPLTLYGLPASILLYLIWPPIFLIKNGVILSLTFFAIWRYGWLALNSLRAAIYAHVVYPRLKRAVDRLPEEKKYPDHIYFLIPSYKEEAWVSIESFRSIMTELATVPCKATIVVATSGDPKEDAVIYQTCEAYRAFEKTELIFQHQKEGKRIAMGHAARAIARRFFDRDDDPNSVTLMMDGDSYLEKGFLRKTLPHFAVDTRLGALTTNEAAYIHTRSEWYRDWFNLKFGQRHLLFQSHSLSNKVLTLTGRLSMYRTRIIVQEPFIKRLENDIITTVMHGKFRFLMGDDKTTWFNLLEVGWNMRYIPDALCYSIESRDADFLELSRSLPYRWYGNTLRNTHRALALGPRRIGSFFIWWAILDQRLSMWTSLVGITGAVTLGLFVSIYYLLFYLIWVVYVRLLQMLLISYNGHPVSWRTLPLMLYTQWFGALVKIKAQFHLSDQKWSKGKETQQSDDSIAAIDHPLFHRMPKIMMTFSFALFFFLIFLSHGIIALPDWDVVSDTIVPPANSKTLRAVEYGVVPDDGRDDAEALNRLIATAPEGATILLPKGRLDLFETVRIDRDRLHIQGAGRDHTLIVSHLQTPAVAAILIQGRRLKRIGHLVQTLSTNASYAYADLTTHRPSTMWWLIRQPNDDTFLRTIGAKVWHRRYPYLRQEIVRLLEYDPQKGIASFEYPIRTPFTPDMAEIFDLKMVENIEISDLTLKQIIPGYRIEEVKGCYCNAFKNYRVDLLRCEYAAHTYLHRLRLLQASRHPLALESSYDVTMEHLDISGSWNKGKGGNGYVRLARTFHSRLSDSRIEEIRHLTIQWSSAYNHLRNLTMGVDINFHGGYAHDNLVESIDFRLPWYHRWSDGITTTPPTARWAPPDGPRNRIEKIRLHRQILTPFKD